MSPAHCTCSSPSSIFSQTGTSDPRSLADPDGQFLTLPDGVDIHYKEVCRSCSGASAVSFPKGGASSTSDPSVAVVMLHGFNGSEFNFRCEGSTVWSGGGLWRWGFTHAFLARSVTCATSHCQQEVFEWDTCDLHPTCSPSG